MAHALGAICGTSVSRQREDLPIGVYLHVPDCMITALCVGCYDSCCLVLASCMSCCFSRQYLASNADLLSFCSKTVHRKFVARCQQGVSMAGAAVLSGWTHAHLGDIQIGRLTHS